MTVRKNKPIEKQEQMVVIKDDTIKTAGSWMAWGRILSSKKARKITARMESGEQLWVVRSIVTNPKCIDDYKADAFMEEGLEYSDRIRVYFFADIQSALVVATNIALIQYEVCEDLIYIGPASKEEAKAWNEYIEKWAEETKINKEGSVKQK